MLSVLTRGDVGISFKLSSNLSNTDEMEHYLVAKLSFQNDKRSQLAIIFPHININATLVSYVYVYATKRLFNKLFTNL